MTTIAEASGGKTPLGAALEAGVRTLSYNQKVTFTQYTRTVLPADGYVFWVLTAAVAPLIVAGSLHVSTTQNQTEADSAATDSIVFTALEAVQQLDAVAPGMIWVAQYDGRPYAFRERHSFYQQTGMHHYRGTALYSTFDSQLINSISDLPTGAVVSNSIPLWLTMTNSGAWTIYPSFAVPPNLDPPYIAVHVPPGSTESLQMQPLIDPTTSTSWQLTRDTVRFTLYGFQNNEAIDFQNYILDGSLADDAAYGIMGNRQPTLRDERQTQVEMQILAQRKTFEMDVSYYQVRVNDVAQKYIRSAMLALTLG